ncbi:hypothetical protein ARTSIC4J27_4330 [Pseudarthrobacter siccitolerans]|uniref:Uncharacterized protein n=1 Tax=Pseudarthrobacter siccitolerans TaxID=861266 RepID=A0A024H821_9MICC|nr:hypothetical protein ARTSIC4J27_4330 [Pseudarthrobacter siccitolerans]
MKHQRTHVEQALAKGVPASVVIEEPGGRLKRWQDTLALAKLNVSKVEGGPRVQELYLISSCLGGYREKA